MMPPNQIQENRTEEYIYDAHNLIRIKRTKDIGKIVPKELCQKARCGVQEQISREQNAGDLTPLLIPAKKYIQSKSNQRPSI